MSPSKPLAQPQLVPLYFRLWSRIYDSPLFQVPFFARVHRRLLDAAGPAEPGAALDVGCGTGELLAKMARRWPAARLAGLDLSPEMLAKARAKDYAPAQVELREGSVESLPFDAGSFDLVTNTISSHYYADFPLAAGEIARVMAPGGRLLMASLGNGPLRHLPGPWREEFSALQATYRAPASQRRMLEEAGLDVERLERLPGMAWLYVCGKA